MRTILSIDGGGIRGIIPASILAAIEEQTGKPTEALFDLIAGTSTGAIVALGLVRESDERNGKPMFSASDMVNLYMENGREIFSRSLWRRVSSVSGLIDERYSHEPLEELLQRYLGKEPLGAALSKVLVSSYNIEQRRPFFFKSWRDESSAIPMAQVVRAATAAPTYFEPAVVPVDVDEPYHPQPDSTLKKGLFALIDGGVFINNPAVSAYAEARRVFPDDNDFLVVSLGTGEHTRPILYHEAKEWGKVEWALPILSVVFDGVSDAVNYQMHQILNQDNEQRFFRFQTRLELARDDMDDTSRSNLMALKLEAHQILQTQEAELQKVCALLTGH